MTPAVVVGVLVLAFIAVIGLATHLMVSRANTRSLTWTSKPAGPQAAPKHDAQKKQASKQENPTRRTEMEKPARQAQRDPEKGKAEGIKGRMGKRFIGRALIRFSEAKGQRWAVVVGWYGLLAFFPILLAVLTVLGLALHGSGIGETVRTSVVNLFPDEENRRMIQQALDSFQRHTGVLALVTLLTLLWSGSVLFGAMDQALDALYPTKPRKFIPQKLMSFGMVLVFTVIAVPVVLSSSILPSLGNLPGVPSALTKGPVALLLQFAVGVLGGALLFLAIYYVVPNRKQGLKDVLGGTLLAGLLFELFTLLFPLYFKLSHGFGKFGNQFGLFFLLMNFFYFIGLILMLGGSVNAERNPVEPAESPALGGGMATPEHAPSEPEHAGARS